MRSTRRVALVLVALACAASACRKRAGGETSAPGEAGAAAAEEGAADEGPSDLELTDTDKAAAEARAALGPVPAAAPNFVARQKLVGSYREHEFRAEVVLQKQGDTLTLIGMSPFGTKGFVLTQRGAEVEYTSHLPPGRELQFPPVFMLIDVHRSLWLTDAAEHRGPHPDGDRDVVIGDLRVVDRWEGGTLRERRIHPAANADGPPEIVIDYGAGTTYGVPAKRQVFRHRRNGYTVDIETVHHQPL